MQAISSGDMNLFQNKVTEEINAANAPKQGAVKCSRKSRRLRYKKGRVLPARGPSVRVLSDEKGKPGKQIGIFHLFARFFHVCKQFYKTSVRLFSPIELT